MSTDILRNINTIFTLENGILIIQGNLAFSFREGSTHAFHHPFMSLSLRTDILPNPRLVLPYNAFLKSYLNATLKQVSILPPSHVDQVVVTVVTFCLRSSVFWALKLIFLILATEDPECSPCPVA